MLQRRTPMRKVSVKKAEKSARAPMYLDVKDELQTATEHLTKEERLALFNEAYPTLINAGLVSKASEFTQKPRKKIKPRSPSNPGWYKWAVENVWNKREHKCEVCDAELNYEGDPPPIVFSHLLERGSYRRYIRDAVNVRLKCPQHHSDWHNRPKGLLTEPANPFHAGWRRMFYLEEQLKREANGLT